MIIEKQYPFQVYPIIILPLSFVLGNAVLNFNVLLFVLIILYDYKYIIPECKKKFSDILIFFTLIFIYQNFVSIISIYNKESFLSSIFSFKYFVIFFYINTYLSLLKKKHLSLLIKLWSTFLIFIVIDAFIQLVFGKNLFGYSSLVNFDLFSKDCKTLYINILNKCSYFFNTVRLGGFFNDELIIGSYLFGFYFIVVFFYKKKFFFLSASFLIFFIVYFSGERMAFLGLSFICFIVLLLQKKFKAILIFASFLIVIFLFGYKFSDTMQNRYNEIIYLAKEDKKKDLPYFSLWNNALVLSENNYSTGIGLRNYRRYCKDIAFKKNFDDKNVKVFNSFINGHNECSTHPHNFYIEIFLELGLLGLVLYLLLFYRLFKNVFFQALKTKNIFISFNIASMIFLMWPLKTTGSFFSTYYGYFFWTILSLNYYFILNSNEK